jgi:hypothetical protein
MDILEEIDLRATFFTEVLARGVVDAPALEEAYASTQKRRHDPQRSSGESWPLYDDCYDAFFCLLKRVDVQFRKMRAD